MIRPSVPADVPRLLELTEGTGLFSAYDVETLEGVLDDYFSEELEDNGEHDHLCFSDERDGRVVGYVYYAPTEYADRTWYLWWIAVEKSGQGRGVGRELLQFAEDDARKRGARLMFIETSGTPAYDATQRFYLKNGYDREAVLRDYYRDGDDKVVFRKRLAPRA
jgi:ribosomal protein S18 acetylase RimI-like enzyme